MKKFFNNTLCIASALFALLTLAMLGAEPTDFSEESLDNYATMFDYGNSGWWCLRIWMCSGVIMLVSYIAARKLERAAS